MCASGQATLRQRDPIMFSAMLMNFGIIYALSVSNLTQLVQHTSLLKKSFEKKLKNGLKDQHNGSALGI